ncbi:MAG: hypothetical protein IIC66_06165, partial [candidate division Zixibacteria bacterium]|nr:hypothetical protein [candidate division Zixibacteria bacterium]
MKYGLKIYRNVSFAAALLAVGILCGCESKIVNQQLDYSSLTVRINTAGASPKLLAQVDQFQVTVVELISNSVVAEQLLTLNGQFVEGQIDSLPSGVDLEFTARAMRLSDGIVIYEGVTVVMLAAGDVTVVPISMSPVVPVMKSTPRYDAFALSDASSHLLSIKIFNIDLLYGASFLVRYDSRYIIIDSTKLSPLIPFVDSIIFFSVNSFDVIGAHYAVAITNTVSGASISDIDGDVVLLDVFYSIGDVTGPLASIIPTLITIEPTGLTDINRNPIDPAILFVDETLVEITP